MPRGAEAEDPGTYLFIGNLTVNDFFSLIQPPKNKDILDFIRGFSSRLKEKNSLRVSLLDKDYFAPVGNRYVIKGDRRLDSLARLLVGDEVCAAVVLDRDNTLYVATNNDGHSYRERVNGDTVGGCPLFDRLAALELLIPIPYPCELTQHPHRSFVIQSLPYLLIPPQSSLKLYKKIKSLQQMSLQKRELEEKIEARTKKLRTIGPRDKAIRRVISNRIGELEETSRLIEIEAKQAEKDIKELKKELEGKIEPLKKFSGKLSDDFYDFSKKGAASKEDLVEEWIRSLEPRLQDLSPPDDYKCPSGTISKAVKGDYETKMRSFYRTVGRFFQDLLKVEEYFSQLQSQQNPRGFLPFKIIDEGGEGVHAEMRMAAFIIGEGKEIPYIGISKLCCAHCNVVMEDILDVRYPKEDDEEDYEEDDDESVHASTRGGHTALCSWPIHEIFKTSEKFLRALLGNDLYAQYKNMKGKSINYQDISTQDRADFALTTLGRLYLLRVGANGTVAKKLGIVFPKGGCKQQADPSIAYSKTSTYLYAKKVFRRKHDGRNFEVGTPEFDLAQLAIKNIYELSQGKILTPELTRLFNTRINYLLMYDSDNIGNEGLLYTPEHINGILNHLLPDRDVFTVIPFEMTIFEKDELLTKTINYAICVALSGKVVVMPLHLGGNHWVGAIFRYQAGDIQVIYNDPQGYVIELEPNALKFASIVRTITKKEVIPYRIVDLYFRQLQYGVDCGPFTVDNLIRIAKNAAGLDDLDRNGIIAKAELQPPKNGDAVAIRSEHNTIFPLLGLPTLTEIIEDADVLDDQSPSPADVLIDINESLSQTINE